MLYLLDTSVFVKLVNQEVGKLSERQRTVLQNSSNLFVLSQASVYELAIKERLNKLHLNNSLDNCLDISRKALMIKYLPIVEADYRKITGIDRVYKKDGKPHGDPFDLLIIAQALRRHLPVLTTDEYFPYYNHLEVIE